MKKYLVKIFIAIALLTSLLLNSVELATIIKQNREIYRLKMSAKVDSILVDNYYQMLIEDVADKDK